MKKIAYIFPGQGSQYSGMGKDLYEKYDEARKVFDRFDSISGKNISGMCFEGNAEDLKLTVNAQPAILAVSLATYKVLKAKSNIYPDFLAGHSLGEYSALYAGGVIEFSEVVKLIQKRAELMSAAPSGSMTALLGMSEENLNKMIAEASKEGIICAANYNTPDQTVISGESKAIEKANVIAKDMGAKRVIPLSVSGAFHSRLMKPVSEQFARCVNDTNINDASIPVVTNVDGKATIDKAEFASKMIKQMYSSVYWYQSINYMIEQGVDTFVEVGSGKVLSGMIKKIDRNVKVYNVSDVESLEIFLNECANGVAV